MTSLGFIKSKRLEYRFCF